jgi:hypothetical protein
LSGTGHVFSPFSSKQKKMFLLHFQVSVFPVQLSSVFKIGYNFANHLDFLAVSLKYVFPHSYILSRKRISSILMKTFTYMFLFCFFKDYGCYFSARCILSLSILYFKYGFILRLIVCINLIFIPFCH